MLPTVGAQCPKPRFTASSDGAFGIALAVAVPGHGVVTPAGSSIQDLIVALRRRVVRSKVRLRATKTEETALAGTAVHGSGAVCDGARVSRHRAGRLPWRMPEPESLGCHA